MSGGRVEADLSPLIRAYQAGQQAFSHPMSHTVPIDVGVGEPVVLVMMHPALLEMIHNEMKFKYDPRSADYLEEEDVG